MFIELFWLDVTAEALWANIGWKSGISLQRGPVDPKFHVEGVGTTNHFGRIFTSMNVLQLCRWQFSYKETL